MKENPKGGSRKGAGRKPSLDPKQPVTLFVATSTINSFGGKEGVQLFCYSALDGDKKQLQQEKRFPPSDDEIKQKAKKEEKRPIVKGFTKPTNVLKPQEQFKTNFSTNTTPKTLDELKSLCPKELTGIDRSIWISTERQKYGI